MEITPFALGNLFRRREIGAISQLILPLIAEGTTQISESVSVLRHANTWAYFNGQYPIYQHAADDSRMFRFVTAQLVDSGACRQVDIVKVLGISKSTIQRNVNLLREHGSEYFFRKQATRRGGKILTPQRLEHAHAGTQASGDGIA